MGDLSKNFSRSEFRCPCGCGFDTVDAELIRILQEERDEIGLPMIISERGGCRCPELNALAGGAENSQHLLGRAADVTVVGLSAGAFQARLRTKYPDKYGIGCYATFTHIDSRSWVARW